MGNSYKLREYVFSITTGVVQPIRIANPERYSFGMYADKKYTIIQEALYEEIKDRSD